MISFDTELSYTILVAIFPVFAIVLVGYLYGRGNPDFDVEFANKLNMDLFAPALIFYVLGMKQIELLAYWPLALAAVLVTLGSGVLLYPLFRLLGMSARTYLPPMMFGNSGNLGLPLIILAFGDAALPEAVILFVVGTLLHITLATRMLDRATPVWQMWRIPIIQALILGIGFSLAELQLPAFIGIPIKMLGDISVPLMVFSLGVRVATTPITAWRRGLLGALLCPLSGLIMVALLQPGLQLSAHQLAILLVFAALPPAMINYVMAERFNQEPAQVASVVLIGNMASLLVLPLVLAFVL